jgi:hypothetical protein
LKEYINGLRHELAEAEAEAQNVRNGKRKHGESGVDTGKNKFLF